MPCTHNDLPLCLSWQPCAATGDATSCQRCRGMGHFIVGRFSVCINYALCNSDPYRCIERMFLRGRGDKENQEVLWEKSSVENWRWCGGVASKRPTKFGYLICEERKKEAKQSERDSPTCGGGKVRVKRMYGWEVCLRRLRFSGGVWSCQRTERIMAIRLE